jgi:hypothetical protein
MGGLVGVNRDMDSFVVSMARVERGKCDEQHDRRCRVTCFERVAGEAQGD